MAKILNVSWTLFLKSKYSIRIILKGDVKHARKNIGFFKEGDIIEISGKPEGIVIHADSETFMLRPFKSRGNKGRLPVLGAFTLIYSNDVKHYKDCYWVKAMSEKQSLSIKRRNITYEFELNKSNLVLSLISSLIGVS